MDKKLLEDGAIAQATNKSNLSKFITGLSNFSVQYNFQAIAVALLLMTTAVCTTDDDKCKQGKQASWVASTASAVVFTGAIFGQLSMGYLGDLIGRNKAMTLTLLIAAISAMLSSAASQGSSDTIYVIIIVFRFLLGVGLGGVYPLSAVKSAEDSGDELHGPNILATSWTFFWQSPGAVAPWIVAYFLTYNEHMSDNTKWRLVLGIGSIPAAFVVMGSIYETYYTQNRSKNLTSNSFNKVDLWESLQDPVNRRNLVATGLGWFIYDVAYYGMSLFGSSILEELSNSDDVVSTSAIRNIIMQQMIAISTGIPALVLSIYSLKYLGTKWLQISGFIIIAVSFILLAVLIVPLKNEPNALFAVYCILLFALNFGPNLTTFVLPAETYPKRIRASYNGMSAACGKIGAAIGAAIFGALSVVCSYSVIMILCAILSLIGAIVSYYFIGNDDRRGSDYLIVNLDDEEDVEKI